MNEESVVTETTVDNSVDVMEGWDSYGTDYTQEETTSQDEADQPDTETEVEDRDEAEDTQSGEESEEPTEESGNDSFSLPIRYMGKDEVITSREEAIVLAQKGRNYDSVYQRMTEAEASLQSAQAAQEFVQRLANAEAQKLGLETMTIGDYIDNVNVQIKVRSGMSETQARKELELERRENAVNAREQQGTQAAEETEIDRVAKDKAAFQSLFPDVEMSDIPVEVFQTMTENPGMPLAVAYSKHLAEQAQAKVAEAEKQAQSANERASAARRSPGSMKNNNPKAKPPKEDKYFAGWDFG